MKKLSFVGQFDDPSYEGLVTVLRSLRTHFTKKYDLYVNKIPRGALVHVHSSGFFEARKYDACLYSLHTHPVCNPFLILFDLMQYYLFYYSPREDRIFWGARMKKDCMKLLSYTVPRFVKKKILARHRVIVPCSDAAAQLGLSDYSVIPQGIDTKRFTPKARRGKKIVAYFGHPHPSKGLPEILEVFSRLDCETRLYLTSQNTRLLKRIAKKSPRTKIFGKVKDIAKAYQSVDIVVVPLRHQAAAITTPLTAAEAMACGKIVVVSDLPHLKELFGNGAAYCKPHNSASLLQVVQALVEDSGDLGKKARKRIENHLSEKTMLKGYEKLYHSLLHNRN